MPKIFWSVTGLLCLPFGALLTVAQAETCPDLFAKGVPPAVLSETARGGTVMLCNDQYAVLASEQTRGPLWSAEDLTEENLEIADRMQRHDSFQPDTRLPLPMQAFTSDYTRSHYDRGHMTPSGDAAGAAAQKQSFLLSNIVPQTPELNRGPWEGVESAVRGWAREEGEIFVVTGPGYDPGQNQTIGSHRIPVPAVTWKAVYDPAGNGTGAYVCLNTAHPSCRITSVAMLTRLVNIDPFPALPASMKDHVAGMPPIRESPYALAKQDRTRKLLKEWGKKAAQKALRALVKSLVP
ncbi:DNA/RNA non-specific endonuclease [Acetobacter persici]|uniref:DNA/RNA non-specific endonuclease n=1 Tax=Acetobacter persici TaxID=1076596 RepID=UPI001FCC85AA|nr:DNA/RNA non-specific endonuclease [Acetobacter persici]